MRANRSASVEIAGNYMRTRQKNQRFGFYVAFVTDGFTVRVKGYYSHLQQKLIIFVLSVLNS